MNRVIKRIFMLTVGLLVCCSFFAIYLDEKKQPLKVDLNSQSSNSSSTSRTPFLKPPSLKFQPSRKCRNFRKVTAHCKQLFCSNKNKTSPKKTPRQHNCSLEELVKDCGRLRFEHGYEDKPVSPEELNYPIAFAIKMHKDSHQVERLLRTIYRPHNFYCIHVDSKATRETFHLIKNVADCLKNVVVLQHRINVVYASIRVIEAEFACMKKSLESGVKWKYYINLTGQEFVLRTNLELVKILKIFNGANDIEGYPLALWRRVIRKYVIRRNKLHVSGNNVLFRYRIKLMKGSAYGMFSRDFVKFSLSDNIAKVFYKWLRFTYSPEETFFTTLNRWPFAPGGYSGRYIHHKDSTHASKAVIWHGESKCHGRFIRSICVYGEGDLPWLRSRPEVAANKFYESLDPVVLDCLEEWVNGRAYSSSLQEFNVDYYKNLPQVRFYQRLKEFEKRPEYLQKRKQVWLEKVSRIRRRKIV